MKILPLLFASSALVVSGAAAAQTAPEPSGPAPAAEPTAPADETSFTDAQVESFAAAALKIQALDGNAAVTQEQLAEIITESGLEPATYVAILQAMKTDKALAERVQVVANAMQTKAAG